MGNSLLSNRNFQHYQLQLGADAFIHVSKTEYCHHKITNNEVIDVRSWNVWYTVDRLACKLDLKHCSSGSKVPWVSFEFRDNLLPWVREFTVGKSAETDPLPLRLYWFWITPPKIIRSPKEYFYTTKTTNKTTSSCVLETEFIVYGKGTKGTLVVIESKKKSEDENPYLLTVAHYYAYSGGNFFDRTSDIGFSVIATVQASNDDTGFHINVEGPAQHPATALFYMFDEVMRTWNWKPTTCPHCANDIQKQRAAGNYGMTSESDDNDNFFQPARQKALSTVNNSGMFRGNCSGSFIKARRANFFG